MFYFSNCTPKGLIYPREKFSNFLKNQIKLVTPRPKKTFDLGPLKEKFTWKDLVF
jgi:hypothetical protein